MRWVAFFESHLLGIGRIVDDGECGRSTIKHQVRVAYGTDASPGEAPWYAGFWEKKNDTYEHFCGGTIIAPHLIITAAHCLTAFRTDDFEDTNRIDKIDRIRVAVGKFTSSWEVKGEYEQRVQIKNFKERRGYAGPPTYEKDLAVVELLEDLQFNDQVLPACVDWENEGTVRGKPQGYIVGFGRNEHDVPSEKLQAASLYYISRNECSPRIRQSTGGAKQNVMWDQFCAGADGSGNDKFNSVQRGDSGGGYTFKRNNKFYLIGVLSHHLDGGNSQYAVYTNVPEHIDWLKENGFHEARDARR